MAVLTSAVAACGGPAVTDAPTPTDTPAPWPTYWDSNLCSAQANIGSAVSDLGEAYTDAQNFDVDTAIADATRAAAEAKNASLALNDSTPWSPGAALMTDLKTAATDLQKAAGLFKIGAKSVSAATLKQANSYITKVTAALKAANTQAASLASRYGLSC
jgi:uncharacterized protein YPO0396